MVSMHGPIDHPWSTILPADLIGEIREREWLIWIAPPDKPGQSPLRMSGPEETGLTTGELEIIELRSVEIIEVLEAEYYEDRQCWSCPTCPQPKREQTELTYTVICPYCNRSKRNAWLAIFQGRLDLVTRTKKRHEDRLKLLDVIEKERQRRAQASGQEGEL